jgi:hypothetical protein
MQPDFDQIFKPDFHAYDYKSGVQVLVRLLNQILPE